MAFFGGDEEPYAPAAPPSLKKLVPCMSIAGLAAEVFSVKFSPDGKYLAAGCGDGAVRVFNAHTGTLSQTLLSPTAGNLPATILRFRPLSKDRTKNVLLTGNAAGAIEHWHITSGKCLHSMVPSAEQQVYALDYSSDGDRFAAAGKEKSVVVYDEDTRKSGLSYGSQHSSGHSNRIFSVKFHPTLPDMLVSGGWDNTIQIWDARAGHSVRTIYGPHLCGDALDVSDKGILTGSWRPEKQLQLWDFGTGKLIEDINWASSLIQQREPCMVYAAQFSAPEAPDFIAAGGSGANEARVFDAKNGNALIGTVAGLERGVFTLDFAPEQRKLVVAGGDATIRVINIVGSDAWDQERCVSLLRRQRGTRHRPRPGTAVGGGGA